MISTLSPLVATSPESVLSAAEFGGTAQLALRLSRSAASSRDSGNEREDARRWIEQSIARYQFWGGESRLIMASPDAADPPHFVAPARDDSAGRLARLKKRLLVLPGASKRGPGEGRGDQNFNSELHIWNLFTFLAVDAPILSATSKKRARPSGI
jgi:hypothetical protein